MSHKNKKSLIVQMENRLNHYKSFGRKNISTKPTRARSGSVLTVMTEKKKPNT